MSTQLEQNLNLILNEKETKIIPENIKKGVQIFDVTGTLESGTSGQGDVKLFKTIEEMRADTTAKEGDLAIVYREEIQPVTEESEFDNCTFPNTVVLKEAFTGNIYGSFTAVDHSVMFSGMVNMSSSNFRFNGGSESSQVRVEYTSQDGITYTRTDGGEELQEFGTTIKYEPTIPLNDVIGNFMKIKGNYFEGMYEYKSNEYVMTKNQLNATPDYVYEKEFYGKNGVEVGTLQNKENLTKNMVKHRVNIWSNYNSGIICPSDASYMFMDCTNLTTIPLLDTSNVTNMDYIFYNCTSLTTIPELDTSNVTDMSGMFSDCTNLTTIPLLDTSNVTTMYRMFSRCTSLATMPLLNTSNVTDMRYMFGSCSSLNNESLNNILVMCINAAKITSNKTLTYIGLTEEQANKCKTLSNYSAFIAAGWTTGY